MRYLIIQHRGQASEVVYQTDDPDFAYDYVDLKNSQLAEKGIPGCVSSWSTTPATSYPFQR